MVIAIDTGFGQIAIKLQRSARGVSGAHQCTFSSLDRSTGREFNDAGDGRFVHLGLLGPVFEAAPSLDEAVILVKPQFETGREHVGKGGIGLRDQKAHERAIVTFADGPFVRFWIAHNAASAHCPVLLQTAA